MYSLFAGFQRLFYNRQLIIKSHQLIICLCHFGYDCHTQSTLCFHCTQILRHRSILCPTEITPKIQFPRKEELPFKRIIFLCIISPVVFPFPFSIDSSVYLRQKVSHLNTFLGCHFFYTRSCNQHIFVMFQRLHY